MGLRRLEQDEERANTEKNKEGAVLENPHAYKERARRVTLRLAMAANRATWVSCCEMALFIRTGAHVRKTYNARPLYLSRLAYLCHVCHRLLQHEDKFLKEAADPLHQSSTSLSTLTFTARTGRRHRHHHIKTPCPLRRPRPLLLTLTWLMRWANFLATLRHLLAQRQRCLML